MVQLIQKQKINVTSVINTLNTVLAYYLDIRIGDKIDKPSFALKTSTVSEISITRTVSIRSTG